MIPPRDSVQSAGSELPTDMSEKSMLTSVPPNLSLLGESIRVGKSRSPKRVLNLGAFAGAGQAAIFAKLSASLAADMKDKKSKKRKKSKEKAEKDAMKMI